MAPHLLNGIVYCLGNGLFFARQEDIDKPRIFWYSIKRPLGPCWCGAMAAQLICNQWVAGSTPVTSSKKSRSGTLISGRLLLLCFCFRHKNPKIPQKMLTNYHPGGNIYRQSMDCKTEYGRVPEWPMGTDCKSAAFQLRWFESTRAHQTRKIRTCFRLEKGSDFLFSSGMIAIRIFNSLATTANCMPQ